MRLRFQVPNKTRAEWRWYYNVPRTYEAVRLTIKFCDWRWGWMGWRMFGPIDE